MYNDLQMQTEEDRLARPPNRYSGPSAGGKIAEKKEKEKNVGQVFHIEVVPRLLHRIASFVWCVYIIQPKCDGRLKNFLP